MTRRTDPTRRRHVTDKGHRLVVQDGRGAPTQVLDREYLARIHRRCSVCEQTVGHPDALDASGRCVECQP